VNLSSINELEEKIQESLSLMSRLKAENNQLKNQIEKGSIQETIFDTAKKEKLRVKIDELLRKLQTV
jgi:cell division protein FtsL